MAYIGSINFSGLASGLDTSQIIDDLIKIDSRPLMRLQTRQADISRKKDSYEAMKSSLLELKNKVSDLKNASAFNVFSASSSKEEALKVSALSSAREGNYTVTVLSLAQAKSLSGGSFAASNTPLGLSGEMMLNGKAVRIRATDTLTDISNAVNSLNNGIRASVLKVSESDHRLVFTAVNQGSGGFLLANAGSGDLLGSLGFTDGTKKTREIAGGRVLSAAFNSADSTIGSLAGISSQARGNILIRDRVLDIDLSTDTLSSIRDKINSLGIAGVSAEVETVAENHAIRFRLAIMGTGNFTDDGNTLESLGILEGGTSGVRAKFQTGILAAPAGGEANGSTKLTELGALSGETIVLSGTDANGNSVFRTIAITESTFLSDLISQIEDAFSGAVAASLENGRITIESIAPGENSLSFRISANGEFGGSLDFGTVTTVAAGRERLLSEGKDARLLVNNIMVARGGNEVNDVIAGLTLTLKKADPAEEIVLTVIRDTDSIKHAIEEFVKAYNNLAGFVDSNSAYDNEKQTAGPLTGEMTSRAVLSRIRNVLRQTVVAEGSIFTLLNQAGVEFTAEGRLKINAAKLDEALKTQIPSMTSLFSATRASTNNNITFVYNSARTIPGVYSVEITRAAERAMAHSPESDARTDGQLTVNDNFGAVLSIAYHAGENATDIANRLNSEAQRSYTEILRSGQPLTRSDSAPAAQNTYIGEIEGVTVKSGDTITLAGTDHNGRAFQRVLTMTSPESHTLQSILSEIEKITDSQVSASIDSNGRIMVQDRVSGASKLTLSVSSTIEGFDLGSVSPVQKGRNAVSVEAAVDSGGFSLAHKAYGSSGFFTVAGGSGLGLTDGEYRGIDVEGSINGYAGTGNGQSLAASTEDPSAQGITVRAAVTAEELASEGEAKAAISLVSGIADSLFRELSSLTDPAGGFVTAKIDSYERSLSGLTKNITQAQKRIDQRREMYVRKYSDLEISLSRLQSLQQRLSSTLSMLKI